MRQIEVFADVGCPFAHASLRTFTTIRDQRGATAPRLWVRAWPLELINGAPTTGSYLAPEIAALQAGPAPDLFDGFDAAEFPASTHPAMASAAAAYRVSLERGEAFSLAVRDALWEDGLDIADPAVLAALRSDLGVPDPTSEDDASVEADLTAGRRRGVDGSPHFFTANDDFFCPSLEITKDNSDTMLVHFDVDGFREFAAAVFD